MIDTVDDMRNHPSDLAAHGESPTAIDGRCIPALGVARRSNIPDILPPRALIAGRLARLGATRDFHHGLLAWGTREERMLMDIELSW